MLVVVSLTVYRRVAFGVKVCPRLNTNRIVIATTPVYPCTFVLRLQVIVFDVVNVTAECY